MCSHCGGQLVLLGQLGPMLWGRCRQCGANQGTLLSKEDLEDEEFMEALELELELQAEGA